MGEAAGRVEAAAPSRRPRLRRAPAPGSHPRSAAQRACPERSRPPGGAGRSGSGSWRLPRGRRARVRAGRGVPPGHAARPLRAGLARDGRPRRARTEAGVHLSPGGRPRIWLLGRCRRGGGLWTRAARSHGPLPNFGPASPCPSGHRRRPPRPSRRPPVPPVPDPGTHVHAGRLAARPPGPTPGRGLAEVGAPPTAPVAPPTPRLCPAHRSLAPPLPAG